MSLSNDFESVVAAATRDIEVGQHLQLKKVWECLGLPSFYLPPLPLQKRSVDSPLPEELTFEEDEISIK